jgi:Reverse transcriptase (RNA-dependent DNA polymerase)
LIIDGFTCLLKDTNSGVLQGSSISPILFITYLSGIFNKIEQQSPDIIALSFTDNIAFQALEKTVKNIQEALSNAREQAIAWGLTNNVTFNVDKIEAVLFIKKRKIRQNLLNYNIKIQNHNIKFEKEATCWLEI